MTIDAALNLRAESQDSASCRARAPPSTYSIVFLHEHAAHDLATRSPRQRERRAQRQLGRLFSSIRRVRVRVRRRRSPGGATPAVRPRAVGAHVAELGASLGVGPDLAWPRSNLAKSRCAASPGAELGMALVAAAAHGASQLRPRRRCLELVAPHLHLDS